MVLGVEGRPESERQFAEPITGLLSELLPQLIGTDDGFLAGGPGSGRVSGMGDQVAIRLHLSRRFSQAGAGIVGAAVAIRVLIASCVAGGPRSLTLSWLSWPSGSALS